MVSSYLLRFELFTKQIFFKKIIQKTFLTNEFLKQIILINKIQKKIYVKMGKNINKSQNRKQRL